MLNFLIPAAIGATELFFGNKSKKNSEKQAREDARAKAMAAYQERLYRYNQAAKHMGFKKSLAKDFIDKHGLKPSQTIIDYLNAGASPAPSFDELGGAGMAPLHQSSGLSDFLQGAAGTAEKLWPTPSRQLPTVAPQIHDTGDIAGGTGVGPMTPTPNSGSGGGGVSLDSILHNSNLDEDH